MPEDVGLAPGALSFLDLAPYVLDDSGNVTVLVQTSVSPLVREIWSGRRGTAPVRRIGDGDACPDGTAATVALHEDIRVNARGDLIFFAGACGGYRWDAGAAAPTRMDGTERTVSNHPLGLNITSRDVGPPWAFNNRGDIVFYGSGRCSPPTCTWPPGLMSTGDGLYRFDAGATSITGVQYFGGDDVIAGGEPGEYLWGTGPLSFDDIGGSALLAAGSSDPSQPALFAGSSTELTLLARRGGPGPDGSTWTRVGLNAAESEERLWQTNGMGVLFEGETTGPDVAGIFNRSRVVAPWPADIDEPDAGLRISLVRDVRVSSIGVVALEGDLAGPDVQPRNQQAIVARVDTEGVGYRLVARAGTTVFAGGHGGLVPRLGDVRARRARAQGISVAGFTRARSSSGMDGRGRAFSADTRLVFIARSTGRLRRRSAASHQPGGPLDRVRVAGPAHRARGGRLGP